MKRQWNYRRGETSCKKCGASVTKGLGSRLGLCIPCAKEHKREYNKDYSRKLNKTQPNEQAKQMTRRMSIRYSTGDLLHARTPGRIEFIANELINQIYGGVRT